MQKNVFLCVFGLFCMHTSAFFSNFVHNITPDFISTPMKKIVGLGNALTDILVFVSDEDIKQLALSKGSMNLISYEQYLSIQQRFASARKSMIAGGSAANTINAIASLGGDATFIGKIGNDEVGAFFLADTLKCGTHPQLLSSDLQSGCCSVLITPDGQRTMCTYLGASADVRVSDLHPEMFEGFHIFHIEGYLVQDHLMIEHACRLAKQVGCRVSMDLAAFNVINENKEFITHLVREYVDIVFANEDEALAYTNLAPEEALNVFAEQCDIAIVKIGKRGSLIKRNQETIHVPAITTHCIDSTGAGDYYAGGFLYGLASGLSLHQCGQIATTTAGRICEVVGAKLQPEEWHEIRGLAALITQQNV